MLQSRYRKSNGGGIKEFILGKDSLPNSVLKVLERIGDHKIRFLKVCRAPILDAFDKAINVATLGNLTQLKKDSHIDKLFHLFLNITTEQGENYSLEKSETIQMIPNPDKRDAQTINITLNRRPTVSELLEKTIKMVGPSIYHYDIITNNCQTFLTQVLEANGLLTDKLYKFINQDIHAIAEHIPSSLRFIANKIIRLNERLLYLMGEGMGIPLNPREKDFRIVAKYAEILRNFKK